VGGSEDDVGGVQAVLEGVVLEHSLAFGRAGAGGFLGVLAVGIYLLLARHRDSFTNQPLGVICSDVVEKVKRHTRPR